MDILSIYKTLKETPSDYLVYAVFIFVSVWLFKEVRNTYLKNISDELARSEKSLCIYAKAYRNICKFENNEIDPIELSLQLEQLPSICSKKVFNCYMDWEKNRSQGTILKMKNCIENEMYFHKSQQNSELISWVRDDSVIDIFVNSLKKSPTRSFFWPFLYTFFILMASALFIILIDYLSKLNTINQIISSFYITGGMFLLILIMSILEFIMFKKIVKKLFFTILTIFYIGLIAIILSYRPSYGGIVLVIVCAIYWYIIIKKNLIKIN